MEQKVEAWLKATLEVMRCDGLLLVEFLRSQLSHGFM